MALTLWLTDRSRVEAGRVCPRRRFLESHAGANGYGWARQAQSMPAVTGTLIHDPIAGILHFLKETDELPSDAQIYGRIVAAKDAYAAIVEARGLTHTTDPDQLAHHVAEQTTLLEGLVWAWVAAALEEFHRVWRVVEVEEEHVSIIGCTCGLGDRIGTAEEHDARGCNGIGWMTRGDAVAQHRETGSYAYFDVKSTGMNSDNWRATWDFRVQVMAGVLGAEDDLGVRIDEVYIVPLYKGRYEREWNPDEGKASGPKYQNSPLTYAYFRPGSPPLTQDDWRPKKTYVDDAGKNRRLGKDYQRVGIWAMSPDVWQAGGGLSPSHYWTRWIAPTGALKDTVPDVIGPILRSQWKLDQFLVQLQVGETRVRDGIAALYQLSTQLPVASYDALWASPAFQALLDVWFPQSKGEACQNAFGDRCMGVPLCDRHPGWETPEACGYIARRPHHAPELEQAISRGLLPPADGAAETAEE